MRKRKCIKKTNKNHKQKRNISRDVNKIDKDKKMFDKNFVKNFVHCNNLKNYEDESFFLNVMYTC